MTNPTYFTVEADFRSVIADAATDSDYDPQANGSVSATVTFTPVLATGDLILATGASPRPIAYAAMPVVAKIDVADGRLKLRTDPDAGGTGTYTPVRLLADTPLLELATPLYYQVSFTAVKFNGVTGMIAGFTFQAPNSDTTINLIEVGRQPGQPATGITKIAPGGVRLDGTDLVFSFGGFDIPDPVSLAGLKGPTGDVGPAASISIGTVSAGSSASVTNVGTSGEAVLDFTLPNGDKGDTGNTGSAATVAVGSVSTGSAGSSASVTNTGTSAAAVLDFAIPRGDTGSKGDKGDTGSAATISVGTVSTGNAGSSASVTNTGTAGAAVLDITIPRGDKGDKGDTGSTGNTGAAASIAVGTVTTLPPGSSASVTNVGTSSAAVFDIAIPKGDTGSASNETWTTLADKPAVIAAGATKADARTAIDAEYTGARGVAGGIATLDSAGKVPYSQLPASIMSYQGTWSASGNTPTLADGTGDQGDVYRVSVAGTVNLGSGSIAWGVGDYVIYNGTTWEKSDSTDAVASVNGYTGVVSLTKSDVGLGAVDNTADADKPISTATATALGGKEPTVTAGSTGQYYRGDKSWATLDKNAVGLSNVDNTTDLGKPISTATQTALDGKEASITAGTTGQFWRGDKSWQTLNKSAVGLGNVDNTADADKPVSTATSTALNGKEATANKGAAGGYAGLDGSSKVAIGNLPTGTNSTTVCVGNDSRLSDARTPTSHTHAVADINASTTTALGVGSIELGHASDTTLSRSAAGVLAVEGVTVPTVSGTSTLTNKRVTPRIGSTASSATPSIDTDSFDQYNITALAAAITSVTVTGTPTDGQKLMVRIKDNGTARAIAWGSSFLASGAAALPTTTVISKTHLVGFIYDSTAAKWICVAADAAGY